MLWSVQLGCATCTYLSHDLCLSCQASQLCAGEEVLLTQQVHCIHSNRCAVLACCLHKQKGRSQLQQASRSSLSSSEMRQYALSSTLHCARKWQTATDVHMKLAETCQLSRHGAKMLDFLATSNVKQYCSLSIQASELPASVCCAS